MCVWLLIFNNTCEVGVFFLRRIFIQLLKQFILILEINAELVETRDYQGFSSSELLGDLLQVVKDWTI